LVGIFGENSDVGADQVDTQRRRPVGKLATGLPPRPLRRLFIILYYWGVFGAPLNPNRAAIAATSAVDFGIEFRVHAVRRSAEPGTAGARPVVRA
jgi:hypothetical protein